jgi:tetratricopeptide (TPR) repeat protein
MMRRWRLRLVLIGLSVAILAGSYPTYRYWRSKRQEAWKDGCRAAVDARDWKSLESLARAWLQWDDDANDGRVFLAEALVQRSDMNGAVETLAKVDESYQGALEAMKVRAEILLADLNRPYEAVAIYERMLQLDPDSTLAYQRLIYFYAMTLQRAKLIALIREAMSRHCEPPEAYSYLLLANTLNFSDGLAVTTRWRTSYPDDEILEVAQATYAAKLSSEKTIATFGSPTVMPGNRTHVQECLKKYPSSLEILSVHIDQAIFEGNAKRVTELLNQSPPAAEDDSRFWRYRGWVLSTQGRYEPAEKSFRRAIEISPFEWQSRWLLAEVLRKLGRKSEADEMSRVSVEAKDLQTKLFEMKNARELTDELFNAIYHYVKQTGPPYLIQALEYRL